ncbi:MAG: histidine kinase dimerization/phospho-acceptor domain-containing protein, partial [Cyanobacteria bacterium J06555_13]
MIKIAKRRAAPQQATQNAIPKATPKAASKGSATGLAKGPATKPKTEGQRLFRSRRLRLALWYALVMGGILGLSALVMERVLMQSRWGGLEQEIEATAGTLHDSLEPMLTAATPAAALQQIFPDLCLADRACEVSPTLIERHTTGVSDRTTYYIRLFDSQGRLLAFSPNQPQRPDRLNLAPWQTLSAENGPRYQQFTTILHGAPHQHSDTDEVHTHTPWGYLQVGRTLADFDAETQRIRWTLMLGLPLALGLVGVSSWGLSGLAMQPIYRSYQQQQQFTANAAHELRSPLASLLATVEATLRLSPGQQQQDIEPQLQTIERQG